ncbi:MAG: AAA family ATPase [Chlorobiaceae bacterium]|nr:AAA family ATPase [Chlorobiaceae bacterium]
MIKIRTLTLKNFRGIEELCLPFEAGLTVIAAVNGGGKTTVVDALAMLLSWLTARTRRDSGKGRYIKDVEIKNGAKFSLISAQTSSGEWLIAKSRVGTGGISMSNFTALQDIVRHFRHQLESENSLPVFAFYPVNRAVRDDDFPKRIRVKHEFAPISVYDDFLTSNSSFRLFFEWFREREDIENENLRANGILNNVDPLAFLDPQLQAVRSALEKFLPEYHDFRIKRQPLRMVVTKGDQELRIDSLSVGETCFIALIGDIARRLAIANPRKQNPLEGEGVILIDEIDLHLHPAWQRKAVINLTKVFPNVQFVVTTHSPQILSEVAPESIRLLYHEDNRIKYTIPRQSIGLNSVQILRELMDDPGINIDALRSIEEIATKIDHNEFEAAKELIEKLKVDLKDSTPDIVEAEATIAMLEPERGAGE